MFKSDAYKIILYLTNIVITRRDDLNKYEIPDNDFFNKGQLEAYDACFNMISSWEEAPNYNIFCMQSSILHNFLSSEDLLVDMIGEIRSRLDKLGNIDDKYNLGLKTAYVECLEIIQLWNKACPFGLNFDIETVYPIM